MLPSDIENLIVSYLPTKCDWCSSCCNYEVNDYRHYYPSGRKEPILQNIYICRLCKISKFNFDEIYVWPRGLDRAREVDITQMFPCIMLKKYRYIPCGVIIDEPLCFMSDYHWSHNRRFYTGGQAPEEEGHRVWRGNTDFGAEIGGITGIYQGDGGGGFF